MDAYRVLHVDPAADEESIRAAYRLLARRYHPDGAEPDPARMTEINLAHDELKTRERRALHDHAVASGVPDVQNVPNSGPTWAGPIARRWAANARRRAANSPDDGTAMDFGQYVGWRIADIARHDPDYLRWLGQQRAGIRFRLAIERCLPGEKDLWPRTVWVRYGT
jgi:curved DNA-binding protein CbpA